MVETACRSSLSFFAPAKLPTTTVPPVARPISRKFIIIIIIAPMLTALSSIEEAKRPTMNISTMP